MSHRNDNPMSVGTCINTNPLALEKMGDVVGCYCSSRRIFGVIPRTEEGNERGKERRNRRLECRDSCIVLLGLSRDITPGRFLLSLLECFNRNLSF